MSKFKLYDKVEIVSHKHTVKEFGGEDKIKPVGTKSIIDGIHYNGAYVTIRTDIHSYHPDDLRLIKDSSFKTSNRYKLHKYILSTGFTKQDLSLALNKNQSYLTTETRASQFYNRGDMSDARYKSLRKQIKEAINKINSLHYSPVENPLAAGEVTKTILEVKPKEKVDHKKLEVNINGQVFDFSPDESVSIEIANKPSNNGALILVRTYTLGLVFFVMLIIFGIGCLIYKAS